VFLEQAWKLDDEGTFVELVDGTRGVWVRCDDVQLVQFLAGEDVDDGASLEAEPARSEEGDHDDG
jgi:hypothetical protein